MVNPLASTDYESAYHYLKTCAQLIDINGLPESRTERKFLAKLVREGGHFLDSISKALSTDPQGKPNAGGYRKFTAEQVHDGKWIDELNEGRDLSQQPNNPTRWIQDHYQELMSVKDAQELLQVINDNLQNMGNFGRINAKRFLVTLQRLALNQDIQQMHRYLTNFMLKGSNMGIGEDVQVCIASTISEDIHNKMSQHQFELKRLVESTTSFLVILLD